MNDLRTYRKNLLKFRPVNPEFKKLIFVQLQASINAGVSLNAFTNGSAISLGFVSLQFATIVS